MCELTKCDLYIIYTWFLPDTTRKIDHLGTDVISQEEFRAAIESRFSMELTDAQFTSFVDRLPLDTEGNVQYARFMQQFDAGWGNSSIQHINSCYNFDDIFS